MWQPEHSTTKLAILGSVIAVTLGVHYGILIDPIFGHVHWVHAIHGRFCYIPIVIAAAWFGLRGGLYAALLVSALVLPYIVNSELGVHDLASEYAEIVFYFAVAVLAGALFDRELRSRKRAEEMRIQLERSQKLSLVGQIAAGMAHEIKNPLASVKGAVEILTDESTRAAEREEFRKIIFKEIRRMNGSITDFLEFAKPSEPKFSRVNLAVVVRSSIRQVQTQAHKREIIISNDIEDPIFVNCDEEKFHQVLLNLLINAIDASADGSEVAVSVRQEEESLAQVEVSDSGTGIEQDHLPHVFEPFFTTKSSGTGLGLAIAINIIQRHGGDITLDNRAQGGVTATIKLPMMREEVPA